MSSEWTKSQILEATEALLARSPSHEDVSVRRIANAAGVTASAIAYHFGSREMLIAEATRRVYHRFNVERLGRLHAALGQYAPDMPPLEEVLAALIEPSIRWSLDPDSDYRAFVNFASATLSSADPAVKAAMADDVAHLRPFLSVLRRLCPWFSDGEIGWRVHCLLGIRHNAVRYKERGRVLVDGAFDISDPDETLRQVLRVAVPMFAREQAAGAGHG